MDAAGGTRAAGTQKVIVREGSREVHGYAVASRGDCIDVVWAVASGPQRRRSFPAEAVFLPADSEQWTGVPIADDGLRLAVRSDLMPPLGLAAGSGALHRGGGAGRAA